MLHSKLSRLKRADFPQSKHVALLDAQERAAVAAFEALHRKLLREIQKLASNAVLEKSLQSEFEVLAKGEDRLRRRWTKVVPKISIDLSAKVEAAIEPYLKAIRFMLLGLYAGKDSEAAAKELLGTRVPRGMVFGTYLHAIDAERNYFKLLYGEEAPRIPMTMIKAAFDVIQRQTGRQVDTALTDYKNRILDVIDVAVTQNHLDNVFSVNETAHEVKDEHTKTAALEHAVLDVEKLKHRDVGAELKDMTTKSKDNFERTVKQALGMASAVGAHQAMIEVFGAHTPRMRGALINLRDGKCCEHCEKLSRNGDGSLRVYDLDDFAPAGANFYKKRMDWILSLPPIHPGCRCRVIHLPQNFAFDNNGLLKRVPNE